MSKPHMNVTPLIDVLLVLLIIFMVVAPLRPNSFKTKIPAEPQNDRPVDPDPQTLVVVVDKDSLLTLNQERSLGTVDDPQRLIARLKDVFDQRTVNGALSEAIGQDPNRPFADRIERTVFVKAPRHLSYGSVARVVDAVKLAGAYPISLQIDNLE
jgi:biopolymer transport protein ExbD